MSDLISIIVPVYNSSKYLEECINSILNQTYKNLEIILVNDGSTDGSLKICEKMKEKDKRVIVINKKNTGVSDTRNVGINIAKGKYIAFVDSDDVIEDNMIFSLYNIAIEKKVDVVRCNYREYGTSNKGKLYDIEEKKFTKEEIENVIPYFITNIKNIPAYVWVLLINKDKIVKFDRTLYFMEDTEFVIRLLLNIDSIYFSSLCLYNYRYNNQSASKNSKKVIDNILGILDSEKRIKHFLKENNLLNEELNKRMNATAFSLIISKIKLLSVDEINKKEIKEIFKLKEIKEILNNIEISNISKKILIEYFCLKNNFFYGLCLIIKLKNKLKNKY